MERPVSGHLRRSLPAGSETAVKAAGSETAGLRTGVSRIRHMERKKASDYPQELLDLFHEYQHGDIDRRRASSTARSKFAVGGLTVAAIFESLRPNYAWAQQVPKDDARIKTSYETVPSPQGNGSIKGYFARAGQRGRQVSRRARHPRESRAESRTSRTSRAGSRWRTSSRLRRTV